MSNNQQTDKNQDLVNLTTAIINAFMNPSKKSITEIPVISSAKKKAEKLTKTLKKKDGKEKEYTQNYRGYVLQDLIDEENDLIIYIKSETDATDLEDFITRFSHNAYLKGIITKSEELDVSEHIAKYYANRETFITELIEDAYHADKDNKIFKMETIKFPMDIYNPLNHSSRITDFLKTQEAKNQTLEEKVAFLEKELERHKKILNGEEENS